MRKTKLLMLLLLAGFATTVFAQVSNDNEDEVYKVDPHFTKDYVPGQVLVKMKDGNPASVRRVQGRFRSAGINNLDGVLSKYQVEEMEQLLPNAKTDKTPHRAKAYNGQTITERDLTQLYKVTLPKEQFHQTLQLVDELKALDEVEFAEPNYKLYLMDAGIASNYGSNPYVPSQWYLDDYGVKQLWNKPVINPKRPVIAILDTGVDLTHPDLVDNLWTNPGEDQGEQGYDNDGNGFKNDLHGWDFINNTPRVKDFNMHGTHVAGIAAAANNGIGIIGANPKALIMAVSVMQSDGTGDVATIVKGIDYAVANGATVLNLSLGTYANSRALRQSLERAYQKAVIVAAAGNDGLGIEPQCSLMWGPMFPAAYSFVLGVQATDQGGYLAGFSNFDCSGPTMSQRSTLQDPDGFNYELKAPGTNMLSTIPGGKYKALNGTSMSAPLVAGAISALKMVKQYDTQEILWGDLLHTSNIAQAYAVTNRPAELDLMRIQYRERKELAEETEEDYSGDGEIDAGETVSLYPVIRTTFGAASNIKMKLEMGDEFEDPNTVQILTPGWVDFGMHLDAYGKGVSINPMKLKVASNVADNRHIKMKFIAKCDETNTLFEGHFTMVVNNMMKISGLISEDRTLTADHVYLVNDNIGVMEGVTMTIEPGTRLEFQEGMGLSSFGKLVANGTPEKPIVFTGHNGAKWAGIQSHQSTGEHWHDDVLYTNDKQTLFTLLPTTATPNKFTSQYKIIYYGANEDNPDKSFYLRDYIENFSNDMTSKQHLLTDPSYLTPAVLQMLSDWEAYWSQYPTRYSTEKPNSTWVYAYSFGWSTYDNPRDSISYCTIENVEFNNKSGLHPYATDCVFSELYGHPYHFFSNIDGLRNNVHSSNLDNLGWTWLIDDESVAKFSISIKNSNIIYNHWQYYSNRTRSLPDYGSINSNNYFNNYAECNISGIYYKKPYAITCYSRTPKVVKSNEPSYFGSGKEEIVRPYIFEIGNAPETYGQVDLSNMLTRPVAEAHGIVWKVCVNGKDAQDEYEDLAPLGVGKHKFEVYFNRPMNKKVVPQISFGVRDPWTQNAVAEDGSWNNEGTIYTAYKTITGKTKSDGVNRIYVYGAEDNEHFEIPCEKMRFNIKIQTAGSMATGFAAEAGMGRVNLTWDNTNNNFDDAMGFNIYRFGERYEKQVYNPHYDENGNYQQYETIIVADTICLNQEIVDIETTAFTDYDVKPGETYYYMYKVLSTDLQEYDVSNIVSATPLTATLGDANGSGDVDVADVITTVNYAAGMNPKPFVFEAADMNTDMNIDILDVIGIIKKILNPAAGARATVEATATYTIEDGVLYVESPVALAGVQVLLATEGGQTITVAKDLNGFEQTSAWLSDNDYLFLAYNLNGKTLSAGKHALLYLGDAKIADVRFSDTDGHNVKAVGDEVTKVNRIVEAMTVNGVYDLQGRKLSGDSERVDRLPKGVYIINGKKVVK
ncbi:MAG: S8 family serine peptidase [Bacteroidaceae bacterium]|nr:S8 family serine peptidase [Bacteroidaceae bacterium]